MWSQEIEIEAIIFEWDWKDQPEIQWIIDAVKKGYIHLKEVDTRSDEHAIVLSKIEISDNQAQYLWENHEHILNDEEEE